MRTIPVYSTLTVMCCTTCFVEFAIPEDLRLRRANEGGDWYCPNGHRNYYGETTASRLEREKAQLSKQIEKERSDKAWYIGRLNSEQSAHRHTAAQLRGTKSVVTRFKKKLVAGRCPCCSHEFKDLRRHMKNQHPHFDPDKAAAAIAEKEAGV